MTTDAVTPTSATSARPSQFRLMRLLIAIAIVAIAITLTLPAYRAFREAGLRHECSDNLRRLAIALQNYHDNYLQFPPAYHVDAAGKRTHSWRYLIWPFAQGIKHIPYTVEEPWDGPINSKLHSIDNWLYRCPGDRNRRRCMTNYVAIVGDETMWSDSGTRIDEITDGASNTLMLVEISHSNIHWMEPRDLPIEELDEWLDPKHRPRLFGNHIEGGMVAYADGSVELLSRDVTIERLRALASRAGNDVGAGRETNP